MGEDVRISGKASSNEIPLRPLSAYDEREAEFLIPQRVPRGQITIIGGDGGTGKSFLVVDTVAAISAGRKCLLSEDVPFPVAEDNRRVVIFNAEDDLERVLKARLRNAGAVEENIFSLSLADPAFAEIKFNNRKLEGILASLKPSLMVFDPLQAFLPPEINMAARNAMRCCLNPLIGWGEKYGTSFIIVMHTNKMAGAWGRKRLADSSDMWDIARSVLMVGQTIEGPRYVSQEKNNYGQQAETILFDIQDGGAVFRSTCHKKDRDFAEEAYQESRSAPARENAEGMILSFLEEHKGEEIEVGNLDREMMSSGISQMTLRRAKQSLKESGKIRLRHENGKEKRWIISSTQYEKNKLENSL